MVPSQSSYHRILPPREYGQSVLLLADQLPDIRPHAFGLTLQHDDDGGMLTQLQQVQEALSEHTAQRHSNADITWWDGKEITS